MGVMLPNEALRDGFSLWLEEVVGPRRVRYGDLWLDPFATSCRNTARFAPWLVQVAQGQPSGASDPGQAVADMSAIGVVTGSLPGVTLAPMGERVLERWSGLSLIGATGEVAEIARCSILFREGSRATDPATRTRYQGFMDSFKRLIAIRPPAYWTQDLHHLYMPAFLDQSDDRGFNPFEVLTLLSDGDIGTVEQWQDWASADWDGDQRLSRLLAKVASFRPGGTRAFVRGLEACLIADERPRDFPNLLTSWGYTDA